MQLKNYAFLLALLLSALWQTVAWAQVQLVSGYSMTPSAGTYTPITGGTVLGATTATTQLDSEIYSAVPIGFCFYYGLNNAPFTTFSLNVNGFITMGGTIANTSTPISTTLTTVNNAISAMARDLQSGAIGTASDIRYEVQGTAPSRVLIIQWSNFKRWGTTGNGDNLNFQIRLYETSNTIEMVYGTNALGATVTSNNFQIGLRGPSNTVFRNLGVASPGSLLWATPPYGTANTHLMQMDATTVPASGQTYTWVPACTGAASGVLTALPATACNDNTTVTLNLDATYAGVVSFQSSTDGGTTWTNLCNNNANTVSALTQTLTGVSATTQYRAAVSCGGTTVYSAVQTVTITPPPPITLTATGDLNYCAPDALTAAGTVTLTASSTATYIYTWLPVTGLYTDAALTTAYTTGTDAATVYASPAATTTYTVTGIETATSCTTDEVQTVTVTPLPSATITAVPDPVCSGATANLNVSLVATNVLPTYCTAAATSTADDDIASVSFGTFTNNSTGWPGTTTSNAGSANMYTDYTALNAGSYLRGSSYTLSVTQFNSGTTFYSCYYVAYFDWNHDGDFADAGETFDMGSTPSGTPTSNVRTLSITIPATAVTGNTRMRIVQRESGTLANTLACGTYPWGEVEDYTIIVNGYTYAWSATTTGGVTADGLPGTAGTSLESNFAMAVTPTATTVGTVVYTTTITEPLSGCTNTATVTLNVNPQSPAPTAGILADVCGLQTVNFTATSATTGTFNWYDAETSTTILETDAATTAASYTATVSPPGATYWVEFLEDGNTCYSSRVAVSVVDIAPETISIASSNGTTFCSVPAFTTDLTVTTTYPTITWAADASLSGTTGATVTASPLATTTYTVTATDGTCTATANITIIVNQSPDVAATATPAIVCSGEGSTLGINVVSAGAAPTYCAANATSAADDDIASVTIGSFTNNSTGWPGATTSNPGSANMYTDYTALNAGVYNVGSSYTLSVTQFNAGVTFYGCYYVAYFDWNHDGDFLDAGETFDMGTTTYNVPADNVKTITIAIPATATPGATRMRIVQRESGTLANTLACGTYSWGEVEDYTIIVNAYTYAWSSTITGGVTDSGLPTAATTSSLDNISVPVVPTAVGTAGTAVYTVTVTDPATGCTNTSSVTLDVNFPATAPIVTNSTQCGTTNANLQANSVNSALGTFNWYAAATGGTPLQTDANVNVSIYAPLIGATTSYWVTFTDAGSICPSVRTEVIATVIDPLPMSITASDAGPFCSMPGANTTLTAVTTYPTITWSPATGLSSTTGATVTATPTATTTYVATATDGTCTATSSITIAVTPSPSVTASASATSVCSGDDVTLSASASSGTPPAYCAVTASSNADDDIANFTFDTFTNNSPGWPGAATSNASANGQYTNYTSLSIPAVTPGSTYTASVTQFNLGSSYTCFSSVFIDWNQNGVFTDAGETYHLGSTSAGTTISGSIAVPATAVAGKTRCRVYLRESGSATTNASCTSFSWGEVEDYSIFVSYEPQYAWTVASTTGDAVGNLPASAGTASAANASIIAAPTATTSGSSVTYSVVTTDPSSGCTASATVVVAVNVLPTAPTTNPSYQCGQGQPTLVANSAILNGTFNWYDSETATTPIHTELTTAGISIYTAALITTTTTYYVEFVEPGNPCPSARTPIVANVIPAETISITSTPAVPAYCSTAPEVVTLTATSADPGYIYTWSPSAGLYTDAAMTIAYAGENLATVYTSPTETTTYTVNGVSGICTGIASTTITVTPSPTVTATATPSTLCAGSSTALSAAPPAPTYCPVVVSSSVDDDIASVTIGSYTNNSAGWPGAATNNAASTGTYTDNTALTTLTVTQGGTYPISVTQFNSGTSYSCYVSVYIDWNQNGVLNDAGEVYNLGGTSAGTSIAGSIAVPATALNGKTRCRVYLRESGSATSNGPCNNFNWGEVEDYTLLVNYVPEYAWSVLSTTGDATGNLPAGSETPNVANANITTTPGGTAGGTVTYQVVATDPTSGCAASSQVVVTVNPIPEAPTVSDAAYCGVDIRNITATSTTAGTHNWYNAAVGGTLVHTEGSDTAPVTSSTYTVSVPATITYWVDVTAGGCTGTRSPVTITVSTADPVTITPSSTAPICSTSGSSVTLTASSVNTNYTYTWYVDITSVGTGTSLLVTPTATTTYTLVGFDAQTNCSGQATYTVVVTPSPDGTAFASDTSICMGASTDLGVNLNITAGCTGNPSLPSPTGYCAATATSTVDDDIANVTLGSFSNNSIGWPGATTSNPNSFGTYTDYTALTSNPCVLAGGSYPISVTQFNSSSFFYGCYVKVFIDWNRNGLFTDAGETYDLGSTTFDNSTANVLSSTITVPATALVGNTRMRVMLRESGSATTTLPCTSFTWGEVEDYTITVNGYNYAWSATTTGAVTDAGLPATAGTASATNVSLTGVTPVATGAGTAIYTVTITDPASGCTNTSSVTVNVNALPDAPIVAPPTICGAGAATLVANSTAAGIITWYDALTGGTVLLTEGSATAPVTTSTYTTPLLTTTTNYYVEVTDANGCVSPIRRTVTVVVTPADAITITTTPDPATYCSAEAVPVTLTASSVNTNYAYTWSDGVATVGTGATLVVTPTTTTTYTVTGNDAVNGCANVASTTVTVNPSPVLSVSVSDNTICAGETVSLLAVPTASATLPTYCASNATSAVDDDIASVTVGTFTNNSTGWPGAATSNAASTGTYTDNTALATVPLVYGTTYPVSVTQFNTATSYTCHVKIFIDWNRDGDFADTDEAPVLTDAASTAGTTASGSITVPATVTTGPVRVRVVMRESGSATTTVACGTYNWGETEDYTFLAVGNDYTFAWDNGAGTTPNPSVAPTATTTYTVTVTSANGCTATGSTTVTVYPVPVVVVTPAVASISCTSPTLSIAASGGGTYLWSTTATTDAITVSTPGTYTVTVTSADGCTATGSSVISGSVTPPNVNGGPDRVLTCLTPSATLTATSTTANVTFAWSSGESTAAITVTTAGTYTVTATDPANSCTSTDEVVVTANQTAPNLSVSPTAATLTCATTSATLTASSTTPGTTFAWSTGATTAAITTSTAGTYNVTVTSAINGCTSTASVVVSQDTTAPNAGIGTTTTTLTCATPSANLSTSGGGTYLWSTGATTSAILVSAAGTYSVTVTGTNGCSATSSVVIGSNTTAPSVNAGADQTIACGSTATLTATGSGTFAWNTGATTASITTATLSATTTYTVTVTGTNGCTASDAVVVSVLPCCAAQGGVVSVNTAICPGDPVVASVSGQNNDAVNYAFYYLLVNPATGAIVSSNTTGNFAGVTPGNYLIYGYSVKISSPVGGANPPANGTLLTALTGSCFDLSNTGAAITVPAPFPPFNGSVSDSQGSGGVNAFAYNIQILTLEGGTLPYNFTWNNNGYVRYDIQYTATGATVTIYYADNATWACTVTDSNGCGATNLSFSNVPGSTGNPLVDIDNYLVTPQSNVLSPNGAISITVSGGGCTSGQYTYQWTGPNGFTATTEDITGLASGWYTVVVTCPLTGQTTTGWYWVPIQRRGRSKADDMLSLSVAPNPFTTNTTITWATEEAGLTNVSVYSLDGKQVAELYNDLAAANEIYSLPFEAQNLTAGIYVVRITTASGAVQTAKLTLTK
jgi:hypothetical protein